MPAISGDITQLIIDLNPLDEYVAISHPDALRAIKTKAYLQRKKSIFFAIIPADPDSLALQNRLTESNRLNDFDITNNLHTKKFGLAQQTLLHFAVLEKNIELVRSILAQVKDLGVINAQDADSVTPLMCAVALGLTDITNLLLDNKADHKILDKQGAAVYEYALVNNFGLEFRDKFHSKVLHNSTYVGDRDTLKRLIMADDVASMNALFVINSKIKITEHATDDVHKDSPLMVAIKNNKPHAFAWLLPKLKPTEIEQKNNSNDTALDLAVAAKHDYFIYELLIKGAVIPQDKSDEYYKNILFAVLNKKIINSEIVIPQSIANISVAIKQRILQQLAVVAELQAAQQLITAIKLGWVSVAYGDGINKSSLLHDAINSRNFSMMNMLRIYQNEKPATPNIWLQVNCQQKTPLMLLIESDANFFINILQNAIDESGHGLAAEDSDHHDALYYALFNNKLDVVIALLRASDDFHISITLDALKTADVEKYNSNIDAILVALQNNFAELSLQHQGEINSLFVKRYTTDFIFNSIAGTNDPANPATPNLVGTLNYLRQHKSDLVNTNVCNAVGYNLLEAAYIAGNSAVINALSAGVNKFVVRDDVPAGFLDAIFEFDNVAYDCLAKRCRIMATMLNQDINIAALYRRMVDPAPAVKTILIDNIAAYYIANAAKEIHANLQEFVPEIKKAMITRILAAPSSAVHYAGLAVFKSEKLNDLFKADAAFANRGADLINSMAQYYLANSTEKLPENLKGMRLAIKNKMAEIIIASPAAHQGYANNAALKTHRHGFRKWALFGGKEDGADATINRIGRAIPAAPVAVRHN